MLCEVRVQDGCDQNFGFSKALILKAIYSELKLFAEKEIKQLSLIFCGFSHSVSSHQQGARFCSVFIFSKQLYQDNIGKVSIHGKN